MFQNVIGGALKDKASGCPLRVVIGGFRYAAGMAWLRGCD
ncbi:hypothetical protein C882_3637 [Caenispirillum salinarum AK4]|uniref:Uncharacterized protein n=1 Tax=Caenispirillum salinarum AK4 TaxID=1238182 RepID=K9H0S7_9PROT|nr:hypothetical protein C882_3637 [Caenispirillum salinarum AK4]